MAPSEQRPSSPLAAERAVRVDLDDRSYDVIVGDGVLGSLGVRVRTLIGGSRAFIVADDGLPDATIERARESLEGARLRVTLERVAPGERGKSIATTERLLESLCATAQERGEAVVALGGGIVGDVAGLVAALYRRGVPIVQCPTTLLAMVDASVGGKTGVNLATGAGRTLRKNMCGAFHQPTLVLIDVGVLDSLADRDLRCGLAECVKHAMLAIGDSELFPWLERRASGVLARDRETLIELVARNVAMKARVVAGDERELHEHGGRALLNLGHTFAHAIEGLDHLTPTGDPRDAPLRHGEAVALGLMAAASLGERVGLVDGEYSDRVRALLTGIGLPTSVGAMPPPRDVLAAMRHDKKVSGGRLRLIVPRSGGGAEIVSEVEEDAVLSAISAISA